MKRFTFAVATSFVILSLFSVNLSAQKGGMNKRGAARGTGSQCNQMYNVNSVETITGEVVRVNKITGGKGVSYGIHLLVKTNKETISVHLGPCWFLDKQKVKINPNDKVTLKGTRIMFHGSPAIIASEITKRNETLILRNKNGYPLWSQSVEDY
jgi:hypothetical protein